MKDFREDVKRSISHWAFLPMSQFSYEDSLKEKRPYFLFVSKIGMLVGATFPKEIDIDEFEVERLDSVNDFVEFLKSKGVNEIIDVPEGYD